MANETEQLLVAEQAVQKLLVELEALKKETGGYQNAKTTLEDTRKSLLGLVERTSTLAEQTHSVTNMMGKIGTPEILARAENIILAINDEREQSKKLRSIVVASIIVSAISLIVSVTILAKLLMASSH